MDKRWREFSETIRIWRGASWKLEMLEKLERGQSVSFWEVGEIGMRLEKLETFQTEVGWEWREVGSRREFS